MNIIAIDPGKYGAASVLDTSGRVLHLSDLTCIHDLSTEWIDGAELRRRLRPFSEGSLAVIERVGAMPKQGVSSVFTFGLMFGSILGALRSIGLPVNFVTPVKWKRDLGVHRPKASDTVRKRAALDKARLLFPDEELHMAKHDGRAEALLIAHWYLNRKLIAPSKKAAA